MNEFTFTLSDYINLVIDVTEAENKQEKMEAITKSTGATCILIPKESEYTITLSLTIHSIRLVDIGKVTKILNVK